MGTTLMRVSPSRNAFEMLEPIALKSARWVLRRGGGGNVSSLSDQIFPEKYVIVFHKFPVISYDHKFLIFNLICHRLTTIKYHE
jgi:hypothetical protein